MRTTTIAKRAQLGPFPQLVQSHAILTVPLAPLVKLAPRSVNHALLGNLLLLELQLAISVPQESIRWQTQVHARTVRAVSSPPQAQHPAKLATLVSTLHQCHLVAAHAHPEPSAPLGHHRALRATLDTRAIAVHPPATNVPAESIPRKIETRASTATPVNSVHLVLPLALHRVKQVPTPVWEQQLASSARKAHSRHPAPSHARTAQAVVTAKPRRGSVKFAQKENILAPLRPCAPLAIQTSSNHPLVNLLAISVKHVALARRQ